MLSGLKASWNAGCRVLVLGSFPSAASLAAGAYYGNARNHFWPLVASALGAPELGAAPLGERAGLLRGRGVALWDLWLACEREGSLDSAIRDGVPNDVSGLVARMPELRAILLNGGGAAAAFASRALPELLGRKPRPEEAPREIGAPVRLSLAEGRIVAAVRMPSTSPVPSARFRTLEDRLAVWGPALGAFLGFR
ncbi:MAG: DNA-deoxyinosine glycosylase [Spirochaetales bacterium]|nr:DNA-deoxyinosine glycosylase [Spirochaetales bacterium]